MKRTSLVVLIPVLAAHILSAAPCFAQQRATLQSRIDVFGNCIEQGILEQLRGEPAARSPGAVREACAAHRAALEPVLGAGARAAVDEAASRRLTEALARGAAADAISSSP